MIVTSHVVTLAMAEAITSLVNASYALGEHGMWKEGTPRTSKAEIEELINQNRIVAAVDDCRIVGAIKIGQVDSATLEFGQLAVDKAFMNQGIGTTLINYVEQYARTNGYKSLRLEILYPSEYLHAKLPQDERVDMADPKVDAWKKKALLGQIYSKMGYKRVFVGDMNDFKKDYPDLVNALAVACKYVVYDKTLQSC